MQLPSCGNLLKVSLELFEVNLYAKATKGHRHVGQLCVVFVIIISLDAKVEGTFKTDNDESLIEYEMVH
jgi:hypothetical protein